MGPARDGDTTDVIETGQNATAPFFIIGSVRSGTTLVERILNRHSNLFVPPETFFFTVMDRLGILGQQTASRKDLQALLEAYRKDRAFAFLGLPAGGEEALLLEGARTYPDVFFNLMGHLRVRAGKSRWGEKTPNNLRYVPFIQKAFPDARFILVVRDGRAAVMSRLRHPNWRRNLLGCARHWAADAEIMRRLIEQQDNKSLHVLRFEQLLTHPEETVRAMCEFLAERYEPGMLDASEEVQVDRLDYYRQPWMAKSTRGIDQARATQWDKEYSSRQLKLVETVAGRQLGALGYPLRNPVAPGWQFLYVKEQIGELGRKFRNLAGGRRRSLTAANALLQAN